MSMSNYTEDLCDQLDAVFFTGDDLLDKEAGDRMQYYLDRWNKKVRDVHETNAVNEALEYAKDGIIGCAIDGT